MNGIEGKAVYCKNCGKKLPDDARFCDRCNMSVRKMESKMEMIEELKEERLARKKAKAVQERYKKMQQKKRHRHRLIAAGIVLILALGVISAVVSNIYYRNTSDFNTPAVTESAQPVQSAGASATPAPDAVVVGGAKSTPASGTAAVSPNSDGYIETVIGGISFAYPRGYERRNDSGAYLSLKDSNGEAVITVNSEETESAVVDLMKEYIDDMGGTFINSFTGSNWYTVAVSRDSEMYHRCGVLENGVHVWYEMRYPSASDKEGEYTETIEYMDEFLTEK